MIFEEEYRKGMPEEILQFLIKEEQYILIVHQKFVQRFFDARPLLQKLLYNYEDVGHFW